MYEKRGKESSTSLSGIAFYEMGARQVDLGRAS